MATTLRPERQTANGRHPAPAGLRTAAARRPQLPWVVLGVLVIAGAALGFGLWASRLGERQAVLVAARTVAPGAVIEPEDLAEAEVAGDGRLAFVPAASAASVVGRVAVIGLAEGSLVTPGALGDTAPVGPDEAVVGVALAPGAVPVPDLRVGDRVAVVEVGVAGPEGSGGDGGQLAVAEVYALEPLADGATEVVSLLLAATEADAVAQAAGGDRVRLVLLPTAPVGDPIDDVGEEGG